MRIFRMTVLMLLTLLLCRPALTSGQESTEGEFKTLSDQEKKTEQDLKNLEIKMLRIAEKLKATHPYYAEKLLQALEIIKKDLLADDVREVIAFLEQGLLGKAVTKSEEVKEALTKLLAFLEDKLGIKDIDTKIKQLEQLMEQVKQLRQDEQKLYDETEQFNQARAKEINDFIQAVDKLLKEQQVLREDLGRHHPRAVQTQIDQALKKIAELIKAQENLAQRTEEAEPGDLRKLGELINKLDSLINQQADAIRDNKQLQANEQGLQKALKQLDRLINDQKLLNAATEQAIQTPRMVNPTELSKKQDEIAREVRKVEDLLKQLPRDEKKISKPVKSLAQAAQKARRAGLNLDDELYDLALPDQAKALTDIERARSEIEKLMDEMDKNKPTALAKLAQAEEQMEQQANALAESMKSLARQHAQTARGETINKAGGKTESASQNMKRAREQFKQANPKAAEPQQAKALSDLKGARADLASLRQQLARPHQDTFNKLGEEQAKLSQGTKDLTKALKDLSESSQKQAQPSLKKASTQTGQAAQSMDRAKQSLTKSNPSQARPDQQKAVDALKQAERNLNDLKEKLARQDQSGVLKNLARRQKESEQKARALANQMDQTAKKPGANQPTKAGMNQASQNMNNAANQMNQTSQKVQQSAQSSQQGNQSAAQQQQEQAQAHQQKAVKELVKAKEALAKLLQPQLTKEQKRKLERLAHRQKEIEEATKKAAGAAQKQGERNANQSLNRATNKMNSASQNLSRSQSQQAQDDEQEALDELERTYEELAQKKQALSDQQAQELLGKLDKMLSEILNKQKELNKETIRLEGIKLKEGELSRAERINLNKLAKNQGDLATETAEVNQKLLEEHSAVFSWVLKTVVGDMNLVKELLEVDQRTDEYTQELQEDIIRKLKDLLEALKKERARRRKGGGGQGGGRGKPKLLPNIAELKMIRIMQETLQRKTVQFNQTNVKEDIKEFDPIQRKMLQRLSSQQLHLADLTKNLAEKLAEEVKQQSMQPSKRGE